MGAVNLRTVLGLLRPNVASLGYGLFLAINAASVWGGVFPFLPLAFQTTDVMLWLFGAESLAFTATFLASAAGTYFFPAETRHFMVKAVSVPYMGGWCLLIGAMYLPGAAVALAGVGGALLGVGSAGFYMLWQRLFASQDAREGMGNLIAGTAWAAVLYFALYLIPVAVTAYLIPCVFLPLFGLAVVLKSRTIDLDQPMFEDAPREHPRTYRHVLSTIWRAALSLGTLGFCTGVMRSLAIGDPSVGTFVNALSMGAMLAAAVTLLAVWAGKSLRINVATSYRVFFPVVTTAFLLLPLLGAAYAEALAAGLYALWSVAIMLMMIQCAQVSRDGGINPVFIYGVFGGIMYALHDVGFLGGSVLEGIAGSIGRGGSTTSLVLVTMAALYLLGIMYFIGQGGFRGALADASVNEIELLALACNGQARLGSDAGADTSCPAEPASSPNERDVGKPSPTPALEPSPVPAPTPLPRVRRPFPRWNRVSRPILQADGGRARVLRPFGPRGGGGRAHRPRQHRGPHRRAAVRVREHRAHPFQAHLREARRPQTPRAHRPRRALRAGRTLELAVPQRSSSCSMVQRRARDRR